MADTDRTSGGDPSLREEPTSSSTQSPAKALEAVEMDNLSPQPQAEPSVDAAALSSNAATGDHSAQSASTASQPAPGPENEIPSPPSAKALGKAPATSPEIEEDAIGPAADNNATTKLSGAGEKELTVDMMLINSFTGNRHPYRINEKYLRKRNVNVTGVTEDGKMDPFSITVYTLKELILREWRKDWDIAPREPSSIRLIKMGKMLDDKQTLTQSNFTPTVTSIVHMTVKPQDIVEEDEANKKIKEPGSSSSRSSCCVIL
ncbi:hypothetical protein BX600DRAFT_505304 [Xylariales sp. PMI_506]|nr:hypothetical protein BX600DRAFT_505304 [Xylariales sp. PMI_506]